MSIDLFFEISHTIAVSLFPSKTIILFYFEWNEYFLSVHNKKDAKKQTLARWFLAASKHGKIDSLLSYLRMKQDSPYWMTQKVPFL